MLCETVLKLLSCSAVWIIKKSNKNISLTYFLLCWQTSRENHFNRVNNMQLFIQRLVSPSLPFNFSFQLCKPTLLQSAQIVKAIPALCSFNRRLFSPMFASMFAWLPAHGQSTWKLSCSSEESLHYTRNGVVSSRLIRTASTSVMHWNDFRNVEKPRLESGNILKADRPNQPFTLLKINLLIDPFPNRWVKIGHVNVNVIIVWN